MFPVVRLVLGTLTDTPAITSTIREEKNCDKNLSVELSYCTYCKFSNFQTIQILQQNSMLASKIEIHEDKIANINYLNLTIL